MLHTILAGSLTARPLPTFVSSSSAAGSSSITVTAPSGIQNGDLLIALGIFDGTTISVTPPTGFNVISTGASTNAFFLACKTASSESGNYAFTGMPASNNAVLMLVYRNATRVNTVGSLTTANVTSVSASTITPTFRGVLCAAFTAGGSLSSTLSAGPAGMTQRASYASGRPYTYIFDLSPQEATATGAKSATFTATASLSAIQFQVTNEPDVSPVLVATASRASAGFATTLSINKPTGTQEGDLMIGIMFAGASAGAATSWTGDTGWTEVADQNASSTQNMRVAYKVAGASEPSSYTFTTTVNSLSAGSILTYRYAAYDVIAGSFTTNANPLRLSSISPTQSQAKLIAAGASGGTNVTLGTPTGMTARVTDNDSTLPSYVICDQTVAKGSTGVRSMASGGTTNVGGLMLAIKPTRSL